jgi:hypothetical protein
MQKGTANRLSVDQLYRQPMNRASLRTSAAGMAKFAERQLPRPFHKSLILHDQGAGEHVMQTAFAVGKANHDEADTEKHGR